VPKVPTHQHVNLGNGSQRDMKHVVQESLAKNAALNVALHEGNRVFIDSNQLYRKAK